MSLYLQKPSQGLSLYLQKRTAVTSVSVFAETVLGIVSVFAETACNDGIVVDGRRAWTIVESARSDWRRQK